MNNCTISYMTVISTKDRLVNFRFNTVNSNNNPCIISFTQTNTAIKNHPYIIEGECLNFNYDEKTKN